MFNDVEEVCDEEEERRGCGRQPSAALLAKCLRLEEEASAEFALKAGLGVGGCIDSNLLY